MTIASSAPATTIDFSDQAAITNEGPLYADTMSRDGVNPGNVYEFGNGLTVTFSGFGRNHEGWSYFDASNRLDGNTGKLWGTISNPTITFNQAVNVSSFWVYNISGNLDNGDISQLFSVSGIGPDQSVLSVYQAQSLDPNFDDLFWEVTSSGPFLFEGVERLEFSNFTDVLFDDLTFELAPGMAPEPGSAAWLFVATGIMARRRRSRRSRLGPAVAPPLTTTAGPHST